jgi:23S rRNA (cytidine1920-2'-O)/16S rRNA (cytidine1409-2'-O)-methyltransferase
MAGCVFIGEVRVEKPGQLVSDDVPITIRKSDNPYVSRGGLKLEKALVEFAIAVQGKRALDVGASTGGFTDCLLQHGARQVYALDVGYGQMDPKIAHDPRVVLMERVNIRQVSPSNFPGPGFPGSDFSVSGFPGPFDLITIDVSFIGLRLVLPVVRELLSAEGDIIALVKPQFEVGKGQVGKKGIVRDPEKHAQVLREVIDFAQSIGLCFQGLITSPITGAKGNLEFLLHLTLTGSEKKATREAVEQAIRQREFSGTS